jgi:hypothetical protein
LVPPLEEKIDSATVAELRYDVGSSFVVGTESDRVQNARRDVDGLCDEFFSEGKIKSNVAKNKKEGKRLLGRFNPRLYWILSFQTSQ